MSDFERSDQTDGMELGHVEGDELALYVIDALDPERRNAVESHVVACEECAEGLAREARVEAAFEQVARMANERTLARVIPFVVPTRSAEKSPAGTPSPEIRAQLVSGGRRSRWAGGVAGALAAAAALVLAFSSATARSEPTGGGGMAQRAPGLHDAAGDMSGALSGELALHDQRDALDGG
jgi:anti-sigma factor RsiW